jgi:hypothetical protein
LNILNLKNLNLETGEIKTKQETQKRKTGIENWTRKPD